jgi:4-amino-4-deoxy-L-arabinose transferase-like glycosyltransferase
MQLPPHSTDSKGIRQELWIFLLVLPVYAAMTFGAHSTEFIWDEERYLLGAQNLTKGFFVSDEDPNFVNGPGYPLLLAPFIHFDAPLIAMRLVNGLLVALAAVILSLTIRPVAGRGSAMVAALAVGLHPQMLRIGPYFMSEALTLFTVTLTAWSVSQLLRGRNHAWLWVLVGSLSLAWLILTRVIFGYVAMALIPTLVVLILAVRPWRDGLRNVLVVAIGGLVLCLPYLNYTMEKTGNFPCWSTNSGELLYWMTSTNEGETGHWYDDQDVAALPHLKRNHGEFFERVMPLPILEREAEFKKAAREHFESNPKGVVFNWLCNLPRLAFGFPRSFQAETPLTAIHILFTGPLILFALGSLVLTLRHWREADATAVILGLMALIYIGGSTLAPAQPRYLMMVFPLLWVISTSVLSRYLRIQW